MGPCRTTLFGVGRTAALAPRNLVADIDERGARCARPRFAASREWFASPRQRLVVRLLRKRFLGPFPRSRLLGGESSVVRRVGRRSGPLPGSRRTDPRPHASRGQRLTQANPGRLHSSPPRSTLVESSKIWSKSSQFVSKPASELEQSFANFGPNLVENGPSLPDSGPRSAELRRVSAEISPIVARLRLMQPHRAKFGPSSTCFGTSSGNFRVNSAEVGPESAKFGPMLPELGPEFPRIWTRGLAQGDPGRHSIKGCRPWPARSSPRARS